MDVDDWKLLLAGFAFQVGPFLAFTLWTFVPMSDRRVTEWFAAFGRLHPSGVPVVRERLVRVRWHRRIGALLGAVVMWAVMAWSAIVYSDGGPSGLTWLPLVGYIAGAVAAELRSVRAPLADQRVADLAPRRTGDYLAPWVLPWVLGVVAVSVLLTILSPFLASRLTGEPVEGIGGAIATSLLVLGAAAVSLWTARRVAHLPFRHDPQIDPYLDDAFRQTSIVTCLAGAGLVAAAGSGAWEHMWLTGWWLLPWAVVVLPLCLMFFFALRQPVPWTFGPRIRSAWVASSAPSGASADAGTPA